LGKRGISELGDFVSHTNIIQNKARKNQNPLAEIEVCVVKFLQGVKPVEEISRIFLVLFKSAKGAFQAVLGRFPTPLMVGQWEMGKEFALIILSTLIHS
jgi:hypothetical protein